MAISTDFNYEDLLSLEKAVLVSRERVNALGSQELAIDYNNIPSTTKEECLEYLEANRLEITNPEVSFKTYEGTWSCISISYNEELKKISQTFKIDNSSTDWNLGDIGDEPNYEFQVGDLSRMASGLEIYRAYYWRVADPTIYVLPTSARVGEIWTKTANDNGDGTYDVIVAKEVAQDLDATAGVQAGPDRFDDYPGEYTETTDISTNDVEQDFVSNSGDIPDAVVGEIKTINNVPLENGKFRTTITTRTAIPQRVPPLSEEGGPNYPWLEYGSDYITDANNIIVGKNQTWDDFLADRDRTNVSPAIFKINSISVRPNAFGLFDYTIISNTPG